MKRYYASAIVLMIIAAALGYWTYTQSNGNSTTTIGSGSNPEAEKDSAAAAAITWKTFVTASTDRINTSFDYPEDSTVEEGGSDVYASYAIVKDGGWDVVALLMPNEEWTSFEAGLLTGGSTTSLADADRGTLYRGGTLEANTLLDGSPLLQEELGGKELAVFLPTAQYSPGLTVVLIDVDADWDQDVFDYFTRTFALQVRE